MVTPKEGKPELRFLSSAHSRMVLYICEKFHENISNDFVRTQVHGRNGYVQRAITPKPELGFMSYAHRLMEL